MSYRPLWVVWAKFSTIQWTRNVKYIMKRPKSGKPIRNKLFRNNNRQRLTSFLHRFIISYKIFTKLIKTKWRSAVRLLQIVHIIWCKEGVIGALFEYRAAARAARHARKGWTIIFYRPQAWKGWCSLDQNSQPLGFEYVVGRGGLNGVA